jgi:hypothetical protein
VGELKRENKRLAVELKVATKKKKKKKPKKPVEVPEPIYLIEGRVNVLRNDRLFCTCEWCAKNPQFNGVHRTGAQQADMTAIDRMLIRLAELTEDGKDQHRAAVNIGFSNSKGYNMKHEAEKLGIKSPVSDVVVIHGQTAQFRQYVRNYVSYIRRELKLPIDPEAEKGKKKTEKSKPAHTTDQD